MVAHRTELECLRAALAASGDAAYDWNIRSGLISWHGGARELLRIDDMREIGQAERFLSRVSPTTIADLRRAHADQAQTGDRFSCTYEITRGDGSLAWVEDRGWFERAPDGEPMRIIGTLRGIDGRPGEAPRGDRMTNYDDLTGQYNRYRLREALEHALEYGVRYQSSGVFLQVGIDNLPLIHDTYGRDVAEQVVVAVSRELDRCLRASDVVGRISHDQFGVVLNGCVGQDIPATAEKILLAVQNAAVVTPKGQLPVTVSVGAVSFPGSVRTAHDAMAKADIALEKARRSGNNCFSLYNLSESQLQDLRDSLAVAELVQSSLRERRFNLHFQPIVATDTSKPEFFECLLRMHDGDGQAIPAGEFLPIAERMGLVRSIDRFVLDLVLDELFSSTEPRLAINISTLSTTDPTWLRALTSRVASRRDIAERLLVEITETTALQDVSETIRFVAALREMGCKVALDDFGAGYTSFRHLQELSVDMVKIDGSFVQSIRESSNSELFITTLQAFADGLGLDTVAECVEDSEVAKILSGHGIGYLQGYHFGRPQPERPWQSPGVAVTAPGDAPTTEVPAERSRPTPVVVRDLSALRH